MSFCDGSVRNISSYSITTDIQRRLGNRKNELTVNGSYL